ncbi:MAG: cytochrome c [Bacteroidetes bacterium]|nr:cytochrome c [Bacteroidota bacterium]MBK8342008.1 cytochrome c [Bacteroidota bacterium]
MKLIAICSLVITTMVVAVSCSASKSAAKPLTYTENVKPIIDANCASTCHNAGRPAGGIDLTTYAKVKEHSTTGKLIPAIQHADGAKAMPKKADKLSDANIAVIVNWAASGAAE